MDCIYATFEVLNALRSRDVKNLQPENMPLRSVTFWGLKPLKSKVKDSEKDGKNKNHENPWRCCWLYEHSF